MQLKLHRFVVSGTTPFPIDMLRYDECWPSTSGDVAAIVTDRHRDNGPLRIELVGIKPPTIGRWRSFSWTVEDRVTVIKP